MKCSPQVLKCKKKLPIRHDRFFRLCNSTLKNYEIECKNFLFPQQDPLIKQFLEQKDCEYSQIPAFIKPNANDEAYLLNTPFRAKEYFRRGIEANKVLPVSNYMLAFHNKYDFLSYKMSIIWNKHFSKDMIQNMNVICKLARGVYVPTAHKKRFMHTLTVATLDLVVHSLRLKQLQKLNSH